mgnify:CR=1 FL=1
MLICIGEILVDIFIDGDKRSILPGGAPFNVACNATLYTDTTFIGAVGDDENGKMLLGFVKEKEFKNPKIKVIEDKETTRAIVSLDNGERSFHFEREFGADYLLKVSDIDISKIHNGDIVHIGSLMLSKKEGVCFFHEIINKIRNIANAKISFDINYRDDIFPSSKEAKEIFIKALKEADILKFSIDELYLLSNEKDVSLALKSLLNEKQIAVVTLGSKGSLFDKNGKIIKADSIHVKPIDTTGAGDAFYAYFLSCLSNNMDIIENESEIKKVLREANVVGALTTLKKGAIGSAPNKEDILKYLH